MSRILGIAGWVFAVIFAVAAALSWQEAVKARQDADVQQARADRMEEQIRRIVQMDTAPKPSIEPSTNP